MTKWQLAIVMAVAAEAVPSQRSGVSEACGYLSSLDPNRTIPVTHRPPPPRRTNMNKLEGITVDRVLLRHGIVEPVRSEEK